MERSRSRAKIVARNALALLVGVVVAVVLVSLYQLVAFIISDTGPPEPGELVLITRTSWVEVSALYAAYVASVVAVVCTPIWLLLTRFGLAASWSAAALGFVATMLWWALDDMFRSDGLGHGLIFGLCGAAAGLATWWARPKLAPLRADPDRS